MLGAGVQHPDKAWESCSVPPCEVWGMSFISSAWYPAMSFSGLVFVYLISLK